MSLLNDLRIDSDLAWFQHDGSTARTTQNTIDVLKPVSVSYTHLDVYKRQACGRPIMLELSQVTINPYII